MHWLWSCMSAKTEVPGWCGGKWTIFDIAVWEIKSNEDEILFWHRRHLSNIPCWFSCCLLHSKFRADEVLAYTNATTEFNDRANSNRIFRCTTIISLASFLNEITWTTERMTNYRRPWTSLWLRHSSAALFAVWVCECARICCRPSLTAWWNIRRCDASAVKE